ADKTAPVVIKETPGNVLISYSQQQVAEKYLAFELASGKCETKRIQKLELSRFRQLALSPYQAMISLSYWNNKTTDICYGDTLKDYVIEVHKLRGLEYYYNRNESKSKLDIDAWFNSYHSTIDVEYQYSKIPKPLRDKMAKLSELRTMFDFLQAASELGLD
ncbi:MAG: hypothetical protein ACC707_00835, partial [Thiohalomonadales bacterium]